MLILTEPSKSNGKTANTPCSNYPDSVEPNLQQLPKKKLGRPSIYIEKSSTNQETIEPNSNELNNTSIGDNDDNVINDSSQLGRT